MGRERMERAPVDVLVAGVLGWASSVVWRMELEETVRWVNMVVIVGVSLVVLGFTVYGAVGRSCCCCCDMVGHQRMGGETSIMDNEGEWKNAGSLNDS
jgi:hypothetical protein